MQAAIKCQSLLAPQGALLANSGSTSMLVPKFTESWTQRSLQITFIAAITGLVQNGGLILSYNENEKKLHVKMPRSSRRCFSPWRRGRKTLEADTFSCANRGMGGNIHTAPFRTEQPGGKHGGILVEHSPWFFLEKCQIGLWKNPKPFKRCTW